MASNDSKSRTWPAGLAIVITVIVALEVTNNPKWKAASSHVHHVGLIAFAALALVLWIVFSVGARVLIDGRKGKSKSGGERRRRNRPSWQ